jgi:hypothetical protein
MMGDKKLIGSPPQLVERVDSGRGQSGTKWNIFKVMDILT